MQITRLSEDVILWDSTLVEQIRVRSCVYQLASEPLIELGSFACLAIRLHRLLVGLPIRSALETLEESQHRHA
jgi:hypothetical protein